MRYFLLLVSLSFSLATHAGDFQAQVQGKLNQPVLAGAWWGGLAQYENGEEIFAVQADTRLTPASTLKLLTTAAALEELGPHFRFNTHLYATSLPDQNGVLHGDLYLQGAGDPTLGSTRVVGAERYQTVADKWAKAVQKAGIKRVDGNLYADVSLFEGPSVAPKVNWENMGNYYAAPVSPLSFHDNLFAIRFSPELRGDKHVEVASTDPQIPGLTFTSFVTTDGKSKKDNAFVYGAPGQYELQIFGTIPTSLLGFTIQGAIPDPARFTLQTLKHALTENHIRVDGTEKLTYQAPDYSLLYKLHTYRSPELKDIVVIVNKRSFNLYAEMLLRALAVQKGKKGSLQNGLEELKGFLAKNKLAGPTDTVLYDGSGLSRDNLLTPRTLVNTLAFMAKSTNADYYYKSLATPDDRGDLLILRRFLKPKKKVQEVRVKGGTIDGVKALAGYVHDKNGRLISFAFIANNLASKDESLLRMHEDFIKDLLALP